MDLTEGLVALSLRDEADAGPDALRPLPSDHEVDVIAQELQEQAGGQAIWVFAYGSLIWKPDFNAVEERGARLRGWHRSFCLEISRWRGNATQPGLMLALAPGGSCNGVVYRLADSDIGGQLRQLVRREIGTVTRASTIRWVTVDTDQGPVRCLLFWAGFKDERYLRRLPLEDVAAVLAMACGHVGSCAEYLYLTVKHLEEFGIRDRNLWKLQKMVAIELRTIHHQPESDNERASGSSRSAVSSDIFDHSARKRSLEVIAEAVGLANADRQQQMERAS